MGHSAYSSDSIILLDIWSWRDNMASGKMLHKLNKQVLVCLQYAFFPLNAPQLIIIIIIYDMSITDIDMQEQNNR